MDFSVITDNLPLFLKGTWVTLWLVVLSLFLGFFIAIFCAIACNSKNILIRWPISAYSYVFRGTPMLVQLYIFYYGFGLYLGQIEGIQETIWWGAIKEAWPWALLTLTLNTGGYTCEIIRGAIKNTPEGEIEAAKAMGMGRALMMRRIILPSALRRALPAYNNEIISMLHGSAIVSTITIMDLTGAARQLYSRFYDPFTPFIFASLVYLILTMLIVGGFKLCEKRYLAHLAR